MGPELLTLSHQRTDQDVAVQTAVPIDLDQRTAVGTTAGGLQFMQSLAGAELRCAADGASRPTRFEQIHPGQPVVELPFHH